MDPEQTYLQLEELAAKLGISIRYENLSASPHHAKSGLCKLRGKYIFIMDSTTSIHQKIELLAESLRKMDLDDIYVVPALRSLLKRTSQPGE